MYDSAIKSWPEDDRPREKLIARGAASLSDAELLALVLRTGEQGNSALSQARQVLTLAGSFRGLATMGLGDLQRLRGIGPVKAAQVLALVEIAKRYGEVQFEAGTPFRCSSDIYLHFRERLASEPREQFYAVLLDNRHRKMREVRIAEGSLTTAIVHPRDVFLPVLRDGAAAVIFVHNHPSGDPSPSEQDIELTRRLREVGQLVGVRVLDHIVIGKGRYVSFVDQGMWGGQ